MPPETIQIRGGQRITFSWSEGRAKLNTDRVYQSLKQSDCLLSKKFEDSAQAMVAVTGRVDELILLHEALLQAYKGNWAQVGVPLGKLVALVRSTVKVGSSTPPDAVFASVVGSLFGRQKVEKSAFLAVAGRIRRQLERRCVQLEALELDIQKELKISESLTERSAFHTCSCGNLRFHSAGACDVCGKATKGQPKLLLKIHPTLKQILESNTWLELAIARMFESKGFEVLVGPTVLGLSGTEHEVDIVARDKNDHLLVLAEVTVGRASLRELADLVLRGFDVPAHGRLLVTLAAGNVNAGKYAHRHGIAIVSQVRNNPDHLNTWIESFRRYYSTLVQN